MALTATEQAKLRRYLGWPARFHQLDDSLEHAFDAIAALPEDETEIRTLMTQLADVETRLHGGARDRLQASQVGSITLNAAEVHQLRSEGRRLVCQVARIFGVMVLANAFGSGSTGGEVQYG